MEIFLLTLLFALIAWKRFPSAVYLLCALLPSYLLRGVFFGVPTTLLELMILTLVIVWLIQNRHRFRKLFVIDKRWAMMIALFVIAATISAIIAPNAVVALGIWKAYFIEPIFIFYLIVDLHKRSKIVLNHIILALITGGIVISIVAISQWIFNTGIPIPWDFERRVTGVFDYPNALGLYLGPLAILAFHRIIYFSQDKKWMRVLTIISFFLFILAIILAQSEAALAAVVVTLFLMGLTHPTWRKKTLVLATTVMIIFSFIPFTRAYLIEKITLHDTSGQVRIGQWTETWELIKDHPVLGVGLSGYPTALIPYHKQTHIEIFQYPHNLFLNIWVELGLLGLIAFFFLCFLLFPTNYQLPTTNYSLLLLPFLLHGLVDVPYFKNDLAVMTWIFLALYYANTVSKIQTTKQ